jgi:lysophospholipase L1-like esterase
MRLKNGRINRRKFIKNGALVAGDVERKERKIMFPARLKATPAIGFVFGSLGVIVAVAGLSVGNEPAPGPQTEKRADDPAEMKLELKKGDSILFFGDSLTELAGKEEPKHHVTKGYIRIVRDALEETHKGKEIKVDWVATGGHKVTDMLKRVDKDVIAKKPTIVFIQIGVNDAGAGVTPGMFKAQLEELIGRLQKGGARVILCSLTSLGEKHDGSNPIDKKLDDLAEVARTVAREQKIPLNDLRKAFVEHWKKHNPENKPSGILTYDGNHFNDAGHRFVAEQMLKNLK